MGDDLKRPEAPWVKRPWQRVVRGARVSRTRNSASKPGYPEVIIIQPDRAPARKQRHIDLGQVAGDVPFSELQGDVPTTLSELFRRKDRYPCARRVQTFLESIQRPGTQVNLAAKGARPFRWPTVAGIQVEEGPSEIRRVGQRRVRW